MVLLLLIVSVTVCLLLGIGGGVLIGKLALPQGLSLRRGDGQVSQRDLSPSTSATSMPAVETPVQDAVSPSPLEVSELPAGEGLPPAELPDSETAPAENQSPPEVVVEPTPGPAAAQEGEQTAAKSLPGLPANEPATPATRLVIPSLGVDAPVVLLPLRDGTWDISQLTQDVGHLQGTASPGEDSNVVLAGHITLTQGGYGPFKDLAQLKSGDEIEVYAGSQGYRYVVEAVKVVDPQDVEITYPTDRPLLTLITCANWDQDAQRYLDRVAVVAYLVE